ncbi:hypothetical protein LEP1GSC133_4115 [Leptospira borgpetersenii serovar Pomona str. 200901868]|uniref:Uncharacterized protein n=1 Tax=Leptospira borgpetersenii serovar Pomona str. 200901868 TaxID=1192866 RepID=M6W1V0_LEPBO|nr:hypothetical protein LEP1GSC133_4115 [Leptospira borgpetersenii serovar Pomona str. 200901868]
MGDLKNMRKKIYCSGWGAISELVSKPRMSELLQKRSDDKIR